MKVFVDTGVWASVELGDHAADDAAKVLSLHAGNLVTSTAVLTEVWALLAVRSNAHRARTAVLDIAASAEVLGSDADIHQRALGIMGRWEDQSLSYADATSFALMIRDKIDTAATFDQHFRVFRYGRGRDLAFAVLP